MNNNLDHKIDIKFVIDVLKELLREGTARKIIIKKSDKIILNLPVIVGAVGLIWAPILGLLGAGAIFIYEYDFLLIKKNGEEIDIIKCAVEKATKMKNKINKI